ncbi:MAG: ORF6N domain-containing protein [Arcobacteraceae bacterium]|jgi:phage regulator Rha-like protein|nr:ORF6N domain-containing protein [Arcobacteraceae bacterium]
MELAIQDIHNKIYTVRNVQVMLDKDLAELYGVETKHINQAVRNNIVKFPEDFYFELTSEEENSLRSKILTLKNSRGIHRKYNTKVFTEQGVYMLATILKSKIASDVTISIIRTFAQMRKFLSQNGSIFQRLDNIETLRLKDKIEIDEKFDKIFDALESKQLKPTQGIFYNGQIFDAYSFISDLIREANNKIILIDNYIDDSTLTIFSKIPNIKVTIYTHIISKQLKLDLEKYNTQYDNITIKTFKDSHDRFIIIDDKEIYHIGASLKDLGKKWFAFSKFEMGALEVLERLK